MSCGGKKKELYLFKIICTSYTSVSSTGIEYKLVTTVGRNGAHNGHFAEVDSVGSMRNQ